ncbi:hypothetical protein BN946_scf184985.g110 [Trametes cinnabarina]|uniref:F-box/LRR-repeat protein 15/At3g58940/PEG3-like LRR domain-containing protein n=1 Tax=Pycnoporus cinnabarinus TaxID=5643 RepID=A0A060SE92_PYCCI|nr:hypothetical protein BN946_scf184985.g110 [Trametes cinnabarina]
MGQIPALARTLDPQRTPSAHAFSQLVRSIRIDSCVVWAPFADVVEEELRMIFFRCTALKAFSFAVHWNESACWSLHTDTANVMNWLLASDPKQCQLRLPLTRGLLELDLALDRTQGKSLISCLHTSLEHAHQLIKLKLQTTVDESVPWWDDPIKRPLRLSSLQELILHLTGNCTEVLDYIREVWSLPKLVALTVASEGRAQPAPFFRAHGENLTYLHWYDVKLKSDAALNELLAFCPRLEHLVIRLPCHPACPQLHCPTLRFLDFWETPDKEVPTRYRIPVSSVGAGTPRLERIRTLRRPCTPLFWRHAVPEGAQSIVDPTVMDWPRIFSPTAVEDNEHRIWRFPLWYVVQASWTLFTDQHIDPWEGNWGEIQGPLSSSDLDSLDHHPSLDNNIEDDPTYVHSEGSDEDSEPSLEDVDEDEIDKAPLIPLDRGAFLDMFHASQSSLALLDEIDPE